LAQPSAWRHRYRPLLTTGGPVAPKAHGWSLPAYSDPPHRAVRRITVLARRRLRSNRGDCAHRSVVGLGLPPAIGATRHAEDPPDLGRPRRDRLRSSSD